MYRLIDQHGSYVSSEKTGRAFEYGKYQLATVAARILGKKHDTRYRVVDA